MKQALINLRGIKAGILTEDEDGYTFQYDTEFLQSDVAEAVSLTLPLTESLSRQSAVSFFRRADTRRMAA